MIYVSISDYTDDFAEDKDIARDLRKEQIQPALNRKEKVTIDFRNVSSATQSFIHALISEVIRVYGIDILEEISFQNCNSRIQTIIEIVVEYVQDGIFTDDDD
jgi:F0F1-type ATP synthase membrane subunit a